MFWGIVTAAAFVLCAAKFITHRIHAPKADKLFLKLHAAAGGILPVAAAIHAATQLKAGNGSALRRILGCVMLLGIAALMFSHFFAKQLGKVWLKIHHIATAVTGVCLAAHICKKI